MQIKIQISRHFKIKFRPLAELDPTRPDPPFPVNFLTRPDPTRPAGRVKSRATLRQLRRPWTAFTANYNDYVVACPIKLTDLSQYAVVQ